MFFYLGFVLKLKQPILMVYNEYEYLYVIIT